MTLRDIGGCPVWLAALGVAGFEGRPGATEEEIAQAEQTLGVRFPDDYRAFLRWSDGGGGWIGTAYAAFWSTEELPKRNADYAIPESVPGAVGIGSDGGGECLALDYRANASAPRLVFLPFIGMDDADSAWVLGDSFADGLAQLATEPIDEVQDTR